MVSIWENQQTERPEAVHIIQAGIDKLEEYRDHADLVPAYVLAMGKWSSFLSIAH